MLKFGDFRRISELPTPFWYYDMDLFRSTVKRVAALSDRYGIGVHYALKANVEPRIVQYVSSKGIGADCVSGNEVRYAAAHGFRPDTIVFAGVGKTDAEIEAALDLGIEAFNVESLMELQVIDGLAAAKGVRANVSLRINPDIDAHTHRYVTTGLYENKFGISRHEFEDAVAIMKGSRALDFKGLHFHIGSQITDVEDVYSLECVRAAEIVAWFEEHGLKVGSIDLGGGLGVDYEDPDGNPVPDFEKWFRIIDRKLVRRKDQRVSIEPGRSLVAQCGSLVTRVLFVKNGETKTFLITDAGMNDLIRPALYGAYHKIENISAAYAESKSVMGAGGKEAVIRQRSERRAGEPEAMESPETHTPVMGAGGKEAVIRQRSERRAVELEAMESPETHTPVMGAGGKYVSAGGKYDIVGPVCESSDVWGEGRILPYTGRGDLLAIRSAGAYGSVMSSRYNLRDLASSYFSDDFAG